MKLEGYNEAFEFALAANKRIWEKSYAKGVNYNFPIPDWTLKACFNYWAETQGNKPYIIYKDKTYTYEECNSKARKIANGLRKMGCNKGDRVAMFLHNSPELVEITQACFKLGIIVVCGNPLDTTYEIQDKITDCGARVVAINDISSPAVLEALGDAKYRPEVIIGCGDEQIDWNYFSKVKKVLSLKSLLEENDDTEPQADLHSDDIQVLQYTGGTTGKSSGCCHTNRGYVANALGARQLYSEVLDPDNSSTLIGLPMSHIAGFTTGITANMVTGGSMILMDSVRPSINEVLDKIEKYKPTIWPAVPVMLNRYVNDPSLHHYDISSLKIIVCGAAPLPLETIEKFKELSDVKITEGYGLTEALRSVTLTPFLKWKQGKTGIPYPNVDILIVDPDDENEVLPIGQEGEIIVRSRSVMKGYWRDNELTVNQIKKGWLYTGDIGVLDEDGYLEIKDRKKDVIIVSGFNVYPREIDEVIIGHPQIVDSCTVGIPDLDKGQISKSYIVKIAGSDLSEEVVVEYCKKHLARYKVPKEIEFVDFIPVTKNNKPDRNKLRELG